MINYIIYFLLNGFSFILACLPRKIVLYIGKSFGFLMYYIFPLRKKVAFKNLQIAFPNKNKKSINKIILKSYMHYGLIMMEFVRNAIASVKEKNYNIDDKTIDILNNSQSLIFMTAHIGNWEMVIPIISKYKKMMVVVRDQNNSGGDKFFYKARKYNNVKLISKKGSKKSMLKSLYDDYVLTLASDQNAKSKGVKIDFFGVPASIPKGAGHFHAISKAKIVVGFVMLNQNLKYDFKLNYINIEDKIEQKEELIVKVNKIYVQMLEKAILKNPEQYFWFHKKWDKNIYVS